MTEWPGRVVEGEQPNWPGKVVKPGAKSKGTSKSPSSGVLRSPQATDGDTVRDRNKRVRMLGVDAPELTQQGWTRDGGTVPIGERSRAFLQDELSGGEVSYGPVAGMSYGRPVAPISVDSADAGQAVLRHGHGIAAPDYLTRDPQRRFDYMEAERLARLNGLGQHDFLTQSPGEFRADPDYQPTRRDLAMFWDTPTPYAGMRPEAEAEYIARLRSGTAEEIYNFAREQGLGMDLEKVREWVDWRDRATAEGKDVPLYANYQRGPPVMEQVGDGSAGAGIRGFGSGFLASGLDEVGAVVDAFGGTSGRESVWNSERRLADIWANNQWQNEAILRGDRHAHPVASTLGEVGGALTSGFVIPYGAGARTVPQLARVGAAYGGLEGFLGGEGSTPERLTGVAIGAPAGAIINAAGGKALEMAAPLLRRGYDRASGAMSRRGRQDQAGDAVVSPPPIDPYTLPASPGIPLARTNDNGTVANNLEEMVSMARRARPETIEMDGEPMPSISSDVPRPQRVDQPLTEAQMRAASERIEPRDVLPMSSNMVDGVEDAAAANAGRYGEVRAPNERDVLTRGTVKAWNGGTVAKVGPTDLVGWLRLRGGIQDQDGELSYMGLSNAPRRGMDHVGQEARFGPLVAQDGMTLDDAALAAWEQGYFPELAERPDVNTFLDALRETYNGGPGRRFMADDFAELDAFDAARAERFALERQSAEDGPIWQDRAAPADDAPFPPVEAYEEWPAEAVQRAGNINLDRLETPQDIRRALVQTERRVGFDAATRGRVTQAETERLAADLGMTPEKLLSRRKGQALNAEEALAARQILAKSSNELVNAARRIQQIDDPGDEMLAEFRQKWMKHVAIQEQVAGATAEAGRALGQFKMAASSRAIRGDVLSALVRAGGGRAGLKEAAETLLDAVEMGPGKFNALAEKATRPKWRNKLSELYINMLLSNPPTHIVNMVSNSLTAMLQVPEYLSAAAIGGARKAMFQSKAKERILASEVGARALGMIQGTKEGARLFAQALRTGEADDFVSKVEGDEYKAISGLKGEVIRVPTRLLTAEDQLFKGIARRMELNAQAVRIAHREGLKGDAATQRIAELVADPTDDMLARAMDYGRYLTFQRPLGEFGQGLSKITGSNFLAKVVMPFVRTPINLMKFATERSPAAPLLKEWRADFKAGGERRDLAIAKSLLGSGLAAAMYEAAQEGHITGAVPPDPAKAKLLYADGWQPYSIRIGDRYISYSRLDPISTTIGVAADMATLPSGLTDRQQDDAATMLVASIMGNLASKTWLSGVSSFVEGLSDPGRHAEGWIQRTVGAFTVPAGVAGVARAIDPVARKRESIGDAIKSRVPGMSSDLLPRRDVFGEEVGIDSLGPDFLSPFWQSQAKNDPVVAEMLRIGKGVSAPGRQYTEDGERLDYSPQRYDRYHEIAGRLTYNRLLALIGSGEYSRMNDAAKRVAATKAVAAARKAAREVMDDPDYPLPAKGAEEAASSDWPGREVEAQPDVAWPGKPVASRDVMGDLQRRIPGIRFTSGYRSPEYNESLRARGYNPARDSEHLDASALDMLPPPGKSLGWLRAQVMRYDPKARTLIHDGHLHAGFDDYYAAPALGGMAQR